MIIFGVTLGGAFGAVARHLLSTAISSKLSRSSIPIATLCINIIGSFGLGLFIDLYASIFQPLYERWYISISTGFFGAFTTFSTFSIESLELLRKKKWVVAVLYIAVTIAGSITAFTLGYRWGGV